MSDEAPPKANPVEVNARGIMYRGTVTGDRIAIARYKPGGGENRPDPYASATWASGTAIELVVNAGADALDDDSAIALLNLLTEALNARPRPTPAP